MNRLEYMHRLEELLMDVSSDDRKDALQYYEDYFDEAGFENEDRVIAQLGVPERLAKEIKDGLFEGGGKNEGGFTEHGYDDPADNKIRYAVAEKSASKKKEPEPEIVLEMEPEPETKTAGYDTSDPFAEYERQVEEDWKDRYEEERKYEEQRRYEQERRYEEEQRAKQEEQRGRYDNYDYDYDRAERNKERRPQKSGGRTMWLLLGIFGFPIWFPLLMTAISIVFAAIVAAAGVMLGIGGGSIICLVVGLASVGIGVVKLFTMPLMGIMTFGGGLAAFGLGLLLLAATAAIITKVIPALARGMAAVCQIPFRRGRA